MGKLFHHLALGALLAVGASAAPAQKSNEIHIPIGQSPGLSGKVTVIARIQTLNPVERSLTLMNAEGATIAVRTNSQTKIWLDRSQQKLPNRKVEFTDLRANMRVEVKYRDNDRQTAVAEWIKAEAIE